MKQKQTYKVLMKVVEGQVKSDKRGKQVDENWSEWVEVSRQKSW